MIEWKTKRVGSTKNVNDFDAQQKLFFQLLLPFGNNNGNKKEEEKERIAVFDGWRMMKCQNTIDNHRVGKRRSSILCRQRVVYYKPIFNAPNNNNSFGYIFRLFNVLMGKGLEWKREKKLCGSLGSSYPGFYLLHTIFIYEIFFVK